MIAVLASVALAAALIVVAVELYDGLREAPRHAEVRALVRRTAQDRRDAEEAAYVARFEAAQEWDRLNPPVAGPDADREMWV